jgi:hypothetical protein
MRARLTVHDRAEREAPAYVWFPHPLPGFRFCLSQSGQAYAVGEESCTCLFFQIHHSDCKHMLSLRARKTQTQLAQNARRAAKSAERDAKR